MSYAKVNDSGTVTQYPYTLADLKSDNPNTSFPKTFLEDASNRAEHKVEAVTAKAGVIKDGHDLVETTPVRDGSNLVQAWNYVAKSKEEMKYRNTEVVETTKPAEKDGHWLWSSINRKNPDLDEDDTRFPTGGDVGDPEYIDGEWRERWTYIPVTWLEQRVKAYGGGKWTYNVRDGYTPDPAYQLEYITENGLDAWVTKVAEIKAQFPKS